MYNLTSNCIIVEYFSGATLYTAPTTLLAIYHRISSFNNNAHFSWSFRPPDSPETEAIGWTHCSLGPTAESRQLLWIVHWFVLSLCDRRTDVSVIGCLSCLTTVTRIVFHNPGAVDIRTHCRLCSPTANGKLLYSGVERGKGWCTWVRVKADAYLPEPVRALSTRDIVGPVCAISPFRVMGYL